MRTLAGTAIVTSDHRLIVPVPADIRPGSHQVVVVIQEEMTSPQPGQSLLDLAAHQVALVDPSITFRREDTYGDDGR